MTVLLGPTSRALNLLAYGSQKSTPILASEKDPNSGVAISAGGSRFQRAGLAKSLAQVGDFWLWSDWLRRQATEAGQMPLFINLDETGIKRAMPNAIGMIVGKSWWQGRGRPVQRIPLSQRRQMVSPIAMCTHNTTVQARLPQIWIGHSRIFTQAFLEAVESIAPGRVKFWQEQSSWNNSRLMLSVLTELALALADFPGYQPILVLDCAPMHLTPSVIRMANALNIWLWPVPARCTFLLQPLDCHVFSAYKAYLRRLYRELKDAHRVVTTDAWARMLVDVSTHFMCGHRWAHAFEQVGLIADRVHLTRDLRAVQVPSFPAAPPGAPLYRAVRSLLPRRRVVPHNQLISEPLGRPVRVVL